MGGNVIGVSGDPAGMEPSHLAPPDAFTTKDHTELDFTYYASPDGTLSVGVWQCAPLKAHFDAYPWDELCTVVAGRVTITDEAGVAQSFGPGDSFFLKAGRPCTWEITETLRKVSMAVGAPES